MDTSLEVHPPLTGIRVVDFGHYIAGPLVGMLLADQGADVIKVDRPGKPDFTIRQPTRRLIVENKNCNSI